MINGLTSSAPMHSALTGSTETLARYMDLLSTRQKLVASNLANADTPGYRTQDIDFQFEFMSALHTGTAATDPAIIEPQGLYVKPDGNNVNVDRESRLLAEDTIRFNLVSTLARGDLDAVRKAISEGK